MSGRAASQRIWLAPGARRSESTSSGPPAASSGVASVMPSRGGTGLPNGTNPCPAEGSQREGVTDRSAYFRAYQKERRERLRELWLWGDNRVCEARDCDRSLRGKRRGTRFCSNPCWQRERHRRIHADPRLARPQ